MKRWPVSGSRAVVWLCLLILVLLVNGGCVLPNASRSMVNGPGPTVVFHPDASSSILSCLDEASKIGARRFDKYFDQVVAQDKSGDDSARLHLICLSLSAKADYKQFQIGMKALDQYIASHPDDADSLNGLKFLVNRFNQARISRWSMEKKLKTAQEEAEAELARVQSQCQTELITVREECVHNEERLRKIIDQDRMKIKELHHQIEQLKNIENIIKNREHGP